MADAKKSPVLAPGAELKHLGASLLVTCVCAFIATDCACAVCDIAEDILDSSTKKKGGAKDQYE